MSYCHVMGVFLSYYILFLKYRLSDMDSRMLVNRLHYRKIIFVHFFKYLWLVLLLLKFTACGIWWLQSQYSEVEYKSCRNLVFLQKVIGESNGLHANCCFRNALTKVLLLFLWRSNLEDGWFQTMKFSLISHKCPLVFIELTRS